MPANEITIPRIRQYFDAARLGTEDKAYLHFHVHRYRLLLKLIQELVASHFGQPDPLRVLDVGPSFQTALIRHFLPASRVNTLGFDHRVNIRREGEMHFNADLNDTGGFDPALFREHHLIVFSEVIEHLYTKPEIVLDFLSRFLQEGGLLIIQTPNAVAIHKRLRMLLGQNPYQLILENRMGHYREYTRAELETILRNAKYEVRRAVFDNYFNPDKTALQRLYRRLSPFLPPSFRDGVTIVGQKNTAPQT